MDETLERYVADFPIGIYSINKGSMPLCGFPTSHSHTSENPPYHPTIAHAEVVLREDSARKLLEQLYKSGGTLFIKDIQFDDETSEGLNFTWEALWALSAVGAVTCSGYSWGLTAWGFARAARLHR